MIAPRALAVLFAVPASCGPETISMGYDEPVVNQGAMPDGPVFSCYGRACPYGECSNDEFVTDVDCDDVYPGPVDDAALFCQPVETDDYCLQMGGDPFATEYWLIRCGDGIATATRCASGCSFETGVGSRCL